MLAWIAAAHGWKGRNKKLDALDKAKSASERVEVASASGMRTIPMTEQAIEMMAWANEQDELMGIKPQ